jgi:hypothetical protein
VGSSSGTTVGSNSGTTVGTTGQTTSWTTSGSTSWSTVGTSAGTTGGTDDVDNNGVPDPVDAFIGSDPDLVYCSNFGPVELGGSDTYSIDTKYPVGSEVTVFMFSTPAKLYNGEVPASRVVSLTVPKDVTPGRHKLIQYGQDADGNFRVGGCLTDVQAVKGATQPNAGGSGSGGNTGSANTATPSSRTGAKVVGLIFGGATMLLLGSAMVLMGRRRRSGH